MLLRRMTTIAGTTVQPPCDSLSSRFKGCLVGAVLGDCLGSAFEFQKRNYDKVIKHFAMVDSPPGVRPKKNFTDDTAMTRSVAWELIEDKKFKAVNLAKKFASEYQKEPWRGYGESVVDTLMYFKEDSTDEANVYNHARAQFNGTGSYGNGGAMRIGPASLFGYHKKNDDLTKLVKDITELTHTHKQAVIGAVLQAHAVHTALHATAPLDPREFIESLSSKVLEPLEHPPQDDATAMESLKFHSNESRTAMESLKFHSNERRPSFTLSLQHAVQLLDSSHIEAISSKLGTGVEALKSVPTAIYCFARAASPIAGIPERYSAFERTIILAVLLGGDTDTIASMAGAIAGAYYGIEEVREVWQDNCEGVSNAIEQAEKLDGVVNHDSESEMQTACKDI